MDTNAVGMHGHPRFTGDLDIWMAIDSENAERMIGVLEFHPCRALRMRATSLLSAAPEPRR
jgi:hypothetical protein